MDFHVEIEPQAFEDLDSIADYIKRESSFLIAQRWFNAIVDSIDSLRVMPGRCPLAAESGEIGQEVRLLLHGKKNRRYKIYFAIEQEGSSTSVVRELHVRHWARRPLTFEELERLIGDE